MSTVQCPECLQLHLPGSPCPLPDPTEPLTDISVQTGRHGNVYRVSVQPPQLSCPCAGLGWLPCEWLYKRSTACTCGAGDPEDYNLLHDVSCDSVPCPFCPAEYKGRHTFEGEE